MKDTDDAVRARTSVDRARVGQLTTCGRHPSSSRTTSVGLEARLDGSVEIHLSTGAPAVAQLLARPLATLQVAPPWCEPVVLHGGARRLPGLTDRGALVFRLEVAAVRVGSPPALVDASAYAAARPDPLRCDAPAAAWAAVHGLALLLTEGPLRRLPPARRRAVVERTLDVVQRGL